MRRSRRRHCGWSPACCEATDYTEFMIQNLKALVVVLCLSLAVFALAKPVSLRFTDPADFARRRAVWITLTIAGFLFPSFWLFVLLAVPLLLWSGRKDSNPLALYLLLMHVIPPIDVPIPAVGGVNRFFSLDMYRLLSLTVLLPTALRLRRLGKDSGDGHSKVLEFLLWGYGALQILLFVRPDVPDPFQLHDSATNVLRRAFLFVIDTYLLYYVASRGTSDRRLMTDSLATYLLACLILAPMAIFEGLKPWALYGNVGSAWGQAFNAHYSFRGGALRAVVSTGHSLALGYLLATALAAWLYFRKFVDSKLYQIAIPLTLSLGLLFAYSRGPWVGAFLIYLVFKFVAPRGGYSALIKALALSAALFAILLVSPLGDRVLKVLPFTGGTSQSTYNIIYRERLAERSLQLVEQHPLLGDQDAYSALSDLRQGEGIIDFVDTYAQVAVFYGILGLFFFAGFMLVALLKVYRAGKELQQRDPDLALVGASLAAGIVGTLVMISSCSFIFGYAQMFYILAGLAAAYIQLGRKRLAEPAVLPSAHTGMSPVEV